MLSTLSLHACGVSSAFSVCLPRYDGYASARRRSLVLPASLLADLEKRIGAFEVVRPVRGGCINPAVRIESGGQRLFLKYNPGAPAGFFGAEAEGLDRIRATRTLRVPEVVATSEATQSSGSGNATAGWILLEWLDSVHPSPQHWAQLGAALAAMHRSRSGWGLERDGFIGSLPQTNGPTADWASFWIERRLEPQLRLASGAGRHPGSKEQWYRLFRALPAVLEPAESEGAALLHGDLWRGNVLMGSAGEPMLVDPAVYYGHREVDLAMADLFGGFDVGFRQTYEEEWPLQPAYDLRRGVYQLYYLLVHVNLFGGGYPEQTRGLLDSILSKI